MTASTAMAEQIEERARPALDDPARAALREQIRAEIARARPRPVAVRTLELMVEATLEPDGTEAGYRILDRSGAPRLRDGTAEPLALADLVTELRGRHPALFLPPEPAPAPVPEPEAKEPPLLSGASEMRAATARFVETQSERARSLAERSSVQGRALAQTAAGRFATLRADLRARLGRPPADPAAAPQAAEPAAWNAGSGWLGETLRDGMGRLRDRLAGPADEVGRQHRRWLLGTSAAALVAVVAAGLVMTGRESGPASPSATEPPPAQQATRAPSIPDTVTPPPETGGESEAEATPPAPNALTGQTQVVDTATLKVGGKVVHLFGVEWVRGGQADELSRYIANRPVTCLPAPGSQTMNCTVDGRDLSEVVLFNGGGRASPEASPELVAAEDHARSERLGVWKR